jgi:hypothetical protein
MSTPPITGWIPKVSAEPKPEEVHRLLTLAFQKLNNHAVAFGLQQEKINSLKAGASTTIVEGGGSGGGGTITPASPGGVPINNQSSSTSYATASTDDGALIVLSDASPIAVSLTSQSPPWSCFIANQSALGGGTATLTPVTGTISYAGHPAASSMPLLPAYGTLVAFDGTNWFAFTMPIVPVTFSAILHQFLTAYDAATGVFSAAQPDYSDLTGTPQLANTIAPVAGEFLTGYDATTGNFSQATPTGLSVTITTAALTALGTQGSMQFQNGILIAQTPAT